MLRSPDVDLIALQPYLITASETGMRRGSPRLRTGSFTRLPPH